ncbi:MAG: hypothetical protein ACRCST_13165 [Turicibacter sp.]
MELYGAGVVHKAFGKGKITEVSDNYVKVFFDTLDTEKKFSYPTAFGMFLELEDEEFTTIIDEDKKQIELEELELKKIRDEQLQQAELLKQKQAALSSLKKTTSKKTIGNNISFKCTYCDGGCHQDSVGYQGVCSDEMINQNINVAKIPWCSHPKTPCSQYLNGEISREELEKQYQDEDGFICYESQMLNQWRVYSGITQSGKNKGKPMVLKNVKPNSLAIMTTRVPESNDEDRFIFGVFLINENYEGDTTDEGYVESDPKYKMKLSLDEAKQLLFWEYYFNPTNPEKMVYGNVLHRYMTNNQCAQILEKIVGIKQGTEDEQLAKEFLEYYCKLKGIEVNNIPMPTGSLHQIKL